MHRRVCIPGAVLDKLRARCLDIIALGSSLGNPPRPNRPFSMIVARLLVVVFLQPLRPGPGTGGNRLGWLSTEY